MGNKRPKKARHAHAANFTPAGGDHPSPNTALTPLSSVAVLVAGIALGISGEMAVRRLQATADGNDEAAHFRMLFSTPLYVDNLAGVVDIAALNTLALDGYARVTKNPTVKTQLRNAMMQNLGSGAKFEKEQEESSYYRANDMLYFYQTNTGRNGIDLWGDYRDAYVSKNGSIQVMMNHISQTVVPRYLAAMGVPTTAYPAELRIMPWAGVLRSDDEHGAHTHQDCLLSGVVYTQVPAGSSPLVFSDPRTATEPEMPDFLPGQSYELHPKVGDVVLFPPWQLHEVCARICMQLSCAHAVETTLFFPTVCG